MDLPRARLQYHYSSGLISRRIFNNLLIGKGRRIFIQDCFSPTQWLARYAPVSLSVYHHSSSLTLQIFHYQPPCKA
ncbi:hypothetical protein Peur_012074 [Populus x canadensis]